MTSAQAAHAALGYGGFMLGGMALALPMAALREVVPMASLGPLPTPNPAVVGGLNLRGVAVPVLDLRLLLGQTAEPLAAPCVVVMVHEGHILGLLASAVTGIFQTADGEVKHVRSDAGAMAICQGTLVRADDGAMVGILSPAAIAAQPHVPLTEDPEPQRSRPLAEAVAGSAPDGDSLSDIEAHFPVMLLRCGGIALSIDALSVAATLTAPSVTPSALAQGHCKGVIAHAGMSVPAVDLQAMLNLGALPCDDAQQAFVLNTAEGAVAFLISEVLDVVRCRRDAVIPVPAFALPHPALFAGALPASALPADATERGDVIRSQCLLIDGEALRAQEQVHNLASVAQRRQGAQTAQAGQGDDARSFAKAMHDGQGAQPLLTYMLAGETATPLNQIQEIVSWRPDMAVLEPRGKLLGMLVQRGVSVPVVCLNGLLGLPAPAMNATVSVLLVASDGECVGFAVTQLRSIETSSWEPSLQGGPSPHSHAGQSLRTRQLAKVGPPGEERMLPVLDLQAMARQLQSGALAATPA